MISFPEILIRLKNHTNARTAFKETSLKIPSQNGLLGKRFDPFTEYKVKKKEKFGTNFTTIE